MEGGMKRRLLFCAILAGSLGQPGLARADDPVGANQFGKVDFPTSCKPAVQQQFELGIAKLHSFFYPDDIKTFQAVIDADPQCAMAYWGLAVSQRANPLVPPWPDENLKRGLEAVEKGRALAKTERERDWLEAAEVAHRDKTYARQIKAGAILEPIEREQPQHPGLVHYIIHTYDFEPLAERGVPAADKYAKVAPAAPHAQHMPSHIYSLLGRWEDSIHSNQASVTASRDYAAKNFPGTTFAQEPHAQDFMTYAYLQLGQDGEARRVIGEVAAIQKFSGARNYGRDTGEVAPAVRYVLERSAWNEAAGLQIRPDYYTYAQAMPRFARALGAAHLHDMGMAKQEIEQLRALSSRAENSYWGEQIQVLLVATTGWLSAAETRNDEAVKFMRGAADLEDSTEKHVAMENRLYPMRELLGNMLLELGRPAEALEAYEASLQATPNRLRGFYGAAKAAQASGDRAKARAYFEKVAALGRHADPNRREIREAKEYLLAKN